MTSISRQALWLFARSPFEARRAQSLRLLADLAPRFRDGALLLHETRDERMVPLARLWLRALRAEYPTSIAGLSARFWIDLELLYSQVVAYNLHLIDGWRRFELALASDGLSAIPIKGPTLSARAYYDGSLRQIEDLDALVHAHQIEALPRTLARSGFRLLKGPPARRAPAYARSHQEWLFSDPQGRVFDIKPVPISHRISRPGDYDLVHARLADVALVGNRAVVRGPDTLAMTILACMHGADDGWPSVRHVADVAGLFNALSREDRSRLGEVALEWRQARAVTAGLALCERLGVIDSGLIPTSIPLRRFVGSWLDRVAERLAGSMCAHPPSPLASWQSAILSRDNLPDALRCIWRQLTVPSARDWEGLSPAAPDWVAPFVHSTRLLRSLHRFGSRSGGTPALGPPASAPENPSAVTSRPLERPHDDDVA